MPARLSSPNADVIDDVGDIAIGDLTVEEVLLAGGEARLRPATEVHDDLEEIGPFARRWRRSQISGGRACMMASRSSVVSRRATCAFASCSSSPGRRHHRRLADLRADLRTRSVNPADRLESAVSPRALLADSYSHRSEDACTDRVVTERASTARGIRRRRPRPG